VCAIVLIHSGRAEAVFEGVCAGRMALDPSGEGGFGYDPIFLVPSLRRTMAQLADAEKDQVSHRGQAVRKLAAYLASEVGRGQP
jgi:XTP/dITP diphosphohydrolase